MYSGKPVMAPAVQGTLHIGWLLKSFQAPIPNRYPKAEIMMAKIKKITIVL
jgi:hypothetical protein